MKAFELIKEWVEEQEWVEDSWSCSLPGSHPCGVLRGAPPDIHHMHHPFIALPLGYRSTEDGVGVVLKIYVVEPRAKSGAVVVFRMNQDKANRDYIYSRDCYHFSDPELFLKLERAVRRGLEC
jgi:hypothetical protein